MMTMNLKCCFCNAPLDKKAEMDWNDELFIRCSNHSCSKVNYLTLQTDSDGIERYVVDVKLSKTKAAEGV